MTVKLDNEEKGYIGVFEHLKGAGDRECLVKKEENKVKRRIKKMYSYILCVGICAVIWIVNGRWIIQAVREHVTSEIYMHIGLGIFFTLLTLELALGTFKFWRQLDILWLTVVGLLLYIPSAYLVIASMHDLKHKGKPLYYYAQIITYKNFLAYKNIT